MICIENTGDFQLPLPVLHAAYSGQVVPECAKLVQRLREATQHVRDAGQRHPHRVRVLDWVAFSQGHPGWFQPDGLHLTFPGAHGFTKLFRKGLPLAKAGKFPAPK